MPSPPMRYAVFNLAADGAIKLLKVSSHGTGHLRYDGPADLQQNVGIADLHLDVVDIRPDAPISEAPFPHQLDSSFEVHFRRVSVKMPTMAASAFWPAIESLCRSASAFLSTSISRLCSAIPRRRSSWPAANAASARRVASRNRRGSASKPWPSWRNPRPLVPPTAGVERGGPAIPAGGRNG